MHRALRSQAALHGHSTEAEVREILAVAVKPGTRVCLGVALAALSRKIGLINADFDALDRVIDKTPAEALRPEPHRSVRARLNNQAAATLYLSSVTLAELLFGIAALPAKSAPPS